MDICEACEQFKTLVKKWNYWNGAMDPLPYIEDITKSHKHLIFEERKSDGAGWTSFIFLCSKCERWWELFTWPVNGQLEVKPYFPEYHSTLNQFQDDFGDQHTGS
jgi:hypothetical protein